MSSSERTINLKTLDGYTKSTAGAVATAFGVKPVDVHTLNNVRTSKYREYLLRLIYGSLEINIPDDWFYEYVLGLLIERGGLMVTEYKGAIIPCECNITDYTIFYYPKTVSSANGNIQISRRTVGKDCEILYLDCKPSLGFCGLMPIVDLYAQKMAMTDAGIDINIFNTRTPWLMEADDVKDADNLKLLYQKISNGEPAIFWHKRKNTLEKKENKITTLPVKDNYIADKLIEAKRAIIAEFRAEVGLDSVEFEKKERLLTGEISANTESTNCARARWAFNLARCCKKINAMYNIDIDIHFKEKKENNYDYTLSNTDRPTGDIPIKTND